MSLSKTQLIKVALLLNKRETEKFIDFIESPFFNKNKKAIVLFGIIREAIVKKKIEKLGRAEVENKLFPKQKDRNQKLKDLMSLLMKLLDKYLAILNLEKSRSGIALETAEYALSKRADWYSQKQLRKTEIILEKEQYRDSSFYFKQSKLNKLRSLDFLYLRNWSGSVIADKERMDNLDTAYLIEKLKYACRVITRQNFINNEIDTLFSKEILINIKEKRRQFESYPVLLLYYDVLMMLLENNDTEIVIDEFLEKVHENSSFIPKSDVQILYYSMIDLCVFKINKGQAKVFPQIFSLYKDMIHHNMLLVDKKITGNHFGNIVYIGCENGEFDWAFDFMNTYENYLNKQERNIVYNMNLGYYYYKKKEFEHVLEKLRSLNPKEDFYIYRIKETLLKTYYAMGEWQLLEYHVESFRMYLNRKENIALSIKKPMLDSLNFVKRISKIKQNYKLYDNEKIRNKTTEISQDILEKEHLSYKKWLLECCDEISSQF